MDDFELFRARSMHGDVLTNDRVPAYDDDDNNKVRLYTSDRVPADDDIRHHGAGLQRRPGRKCKLRGTCDDVTRCGDVTRNV